MCITYNFLPVFLFILLFSLRPVVPVLYLFSLRLFSCAASWSLSHDYDASFGVLVGFNVGFYVRISLLVSFACS